MFAHRASLAVRPLACVPLAGVASKSARRKWRNLGFRRDPHPGEKTFNYGGKSLEMTVIKVSSDKTVQVAADMWRRHPTYGVQMGTKIKFLAHDPNNICHPGDKVLVTPSRPYSKQKHHEIKAIVKKDPGVLYVAQHPELYVDQTALKQLHQAEMKRRRFEPLKRTKKKLLSDEDEAKQKALEETQAAAKKEENVKRYAEGPRKLKRERKGKVKPQRQMKKDEEPSAEAALKDAAEATKETPKAEEETGEQPKTRGETQRLRKAEAAKKQAKLIDQVRTDVQSGEMKEALADLRKREAEVKRQYGVDQQPQKGKKPGKK